MTQCVDRNGQPVYRSTWERWPLGGVRAICEAEERDAKFKGKLHTCGFITGPPILGFILYKLTGSKLLGAIVGVGPLIAVTYVAATLGASLANALRS